MSTEVSIYQQVQDPLEFIRTIGQAIATSGMFGANGPAQGQMLAMECMVKKLPPLSLAERYHIIEGKLSMKADAMLAAFRQLGGEHKLVTRTPDGAEIELTLKKEKHRFKLTWEECQQEPFPYGSNGKLKKNWATPRARMQMMWARVVSDGVRAMAPEVVAGYYTPEELGSDATDDEPAAGGSNQASVVADAPAGHGDVIDAEYVPGTPLHVVERQGGGGPVIVVREKVTPEPAAVTSQASTTATPTAEQPQSVPFQPDDEITLERASKSEIDSLKLLVTQAKLTQEQTVALLREFAGDPPRFGNLTPMGAAKMAERLNQMISDAVFNKPPSPDPEGAAEPTRAAAPATNGHATPNQVEQITFMLKEIDKKIPGYSDKAKGRDFSKLSREKANEFLEQLYGKNAELERVPAKN